MIVSVFGGIFSFVNANASLDILNKLPYDMSNIDDYATKIKNNFSSFDDVKLGNSSKGNIQGLIKAFCNSTFAAGQSRNGFIMYDPAQSAFIYLLCSNLYAYSAKNDFFTGYFNVSDFDKLGLPVNKKDIHLAHLYVDDLFNNIINEYFNIKQANVYGLQTAKEEKNGLDAQADDFSSDYFGGIKICSNDDPKYDFKNTCRYMKEYLRSTKSMVNGLNILDLDKMYDDYKNKSKDPAFCDIGTGHNILLCGLRGKTGEKDLKGFINLVYNELFYYNLFVQYYSYRLNKEASALDTNASSDVRTIASEQAKKIQIMNNELNRSQQALSLSIRMLRDSYVNFPIHIGFLMYRESLQRFGKEIVKISTPIYTLYDKLRNVQCK